MDVCVCWERGVAGASARWVSRYHKPDNLSLVLRAHMEVGEKGLPEAVL